MITLSVPVAALAVFAVFSAQLPQPAAASSTLYLAQAQQEKVKRLRVRSASEISRSFELAANSRRTQAIELQCSPASSKWCTGGFVDACKGNQGGMSTEPDGNTVTCSMPQID